MFAHIGAAILKWSGGPRLLTSAPTTLAPTAWARTAILKWGAASCLMALVGLAPRAGGAAWLSPNGLVAAHDGKTLFVSCAGDKKVEVVDLATRKVARSLALVGTPSGLALSKDDSRLFVTCAGPKSLLVVLDTATGATLAKLPTGHTAMAPVLSPDEKLAYVCCRFDNCVAVIDLASKQEIRRIGVQREPVAAALSGDGKLLFVANLLHVGPADLDRAAAVVSVIDTAQGRVLKELELPNGSGSLNDIRLSPDGKYVVVTHILSRFHLPTTQLERGWMNTNAKTIIEVSRQEVLATVLLDSVDSGAANPWGLGWTADGKTLAVAHAGTHEVSLVDWPGLLARLARYAESAGKTNENAMIEVANDLAFLVDLRERVKLPAGDRGPRALAVVGQNVYTANYFSDSLSVIDLSAGRHRAEPVPLGPVKEPDVVRKGEFYFHDAGICFQGWQSCASCHPGDARADGLNWDLLNDGIGNPKNTKSLLLSHRTPPAMSGGVRDTAETAVRSGIQHILFTVQPEAVAKSIDEYLKSLKPILSPHLENGKLSASAKRGEKLFSKAGCISCHPAGLFTDLQTYDVGTTGKYDRGETRFDTPTLIEVWRTAPYLHDGSAATLRDVLTTRNPSDQHGVTSKLSARELDDLCEYVLSL